MRSDFRGDTLVRYAMPAGRRAKISCRTKDPRHDIEGYEGEGFYRVYHLMPMSEATDYQEEYIAHEDDLVLDADYERWMEIYLQLAAQDPHGRRQRNVLRANQLLKEQKERERKLCTTTKS